jgi:hypothetical protein
MSQIEYAVDRLNWLHKHRELVKGLNPDFRFERGF